MCFSAKASFIAAGTLSVIGLLSVRTASKKTKKLVPFAATPFIFALQQACEGVVWIGLTTASLSPLLYMISIYGFLFFAVIWWPIWTSTVLYLIENNTIRQKLLLCTFIVGIITSSLYLISLITQPAQAFSINHHLYYPTFSYPFASYNTLARFIESIMAYLYFIATVGPLFISSIHCMWVLGVVMGLGFLTSQLFFAPTTASTWCFFAALASALIYMIVRHEKNSATANETHSN